MNAPTIAEERIARKLAFWHGTYCVGFKHGERMSIASLHGSQTGWAWEYERYAERHWREYVGAARAILEDR